MTRDIAQSAEISVFHHALVGAAEEMGEVLKRSAFSPNIKERQDYSCALFDAKGRLLAQAAHLPVHLGSIAASVEAVISRIEFRRDGDFAIVNDPYSGGTHLPDITMVAPIYAGKWSLNKEGMRTYREKAVRLIGYAANRAHHADIGGAAPGSMSPQTDLMAEGLVIPPVLIERDGMLLDPFYIAVENSRTPDERHGDLMAQLSSCDRGIFRYLEIEKRAGAGAFAALSEGLISHSRALMRHSLAKLKPGVYRTEDVITNFTFPVGKGGQYRPCGVSSISGSVTDAFRAEYFPLTAATWGTTGDPSLHHISTCEYWTIDRSVGTPSAVITLTWNTPASCGVTTMPDLRVAQWDDTALPAPGTWRDRGNGGATGTVITGTIPTAAVQSAFNATTTAWTLGSISVANPLPIRLLRFTAQPAGNMVQLDWATATETNNAFFTVERSKNGITFHDLVEVPGAINSNTLNEYQSWDDQPLSGLSYYRLRQTDLDGTSTYSDLAAVLFGPLNERPLVIFGDGSNWTALHGFPAGSRYELVDMTGRRILSGNTLLDGRTDFYGLSLSRGAYVLRVSDGERMESQRFVF